MKLFKILTNPVKVNSFIPISICLFFMNNLIAFGSENNSLFIKSKNGNNEFEEIFFKNSIPYKEYDNSESQHKVFFGKGKLNETGNIFYPDLSIINESDLLREIYKSKLNDMTINDI